MFLETTIIQGKALDGSSSNHNSLLDIVGARSCWQWRQPGRMDFSSPCPVTSPRLPCSDPDTLQQNESVPPLGISQLLLCCVAQLLTISWWWQSRHSCPPPLEGPLGMKEKLSRLHLSFNTPEHISAQLCNDAVLSPCAVRPHHLCCAAVPGSIHVGWDGMGSPRHGAA